MSAWVQNFSESVFRFISKLIWIFSGDRHPIGIERNSGFELVGECGTCPRCTPARRQRLEATCTLIENYIADNLALYDHLEGVLQLQRLNINRQLTLLKNLNDSSEHLKVAISDCLEKHLDCVNNFSKGIENLQINQKVEENVAIARFEENMDEFRRNLIGNIVNNQTRNISDLLQE